MRTRWHVPVPEQYRWLCQVLGGHYRYYGVTSNFDALKRFHFLVKRIWFKALQRRGRKKKLRWWQFDRLQALYPLPKPTIYHSWTSVAG